jgi:hypothetical protein
MFINAQYSNYPQRLNDVHNILQSLDGYFHTIAPKASFTGMIREIEDYQGMLYVTVYKNQYTALSAHEKDYFHNRIKNIWKLFHEEMFKIIDVDDDVLYASWEDSPRSR